MTFKTRKMIGAATAAALIAAPAALAWEAEIATVVIEQVQTDGTIALVEVHVPAGTEGDAVAASTSVGNSGAGLLMGGDIDYDAVQQNHTDSTATTVMQGGDVSGAALASTTAYGNASNGGTWMGNGYYRAEQVMAGDTSATTQINLGNVTQAGATTTAAANVSAAAAEFGNNSAFHAQTSNGNVTAATDADLCCTNDAGSFVTTASGNVATSSGATATSINGAVQTTAAGTLIQSTSDVYAVQGNNIASAVTASGNAYVLQNEWGYASLGRDGSELFQGNDANVDAQGYVTLGTWNGSAVSTAYGVGNSALVSNVGSDTGLYSIQNNFGAVSATSNLTGTSNTGGAGHTNATAIGNAATAVLCNVCGDGTLTGGVTQRNAAGVTATTRVQAGTSGGIVASASAIGNAASFHSNGD